MATKKHLNPFEKCPICQLYIEKYGDTEGHVDNYQHILHEKAIARRDRNQGMRDMGLIKVRGALGGTYWE